MPLCDLAPCLGFKLWFSVGSYDYLRVWPGRHKPYDYPGDGSGFADSTTGPDRHAEGALGVLLGKLAEFF